MGENDRFDVLRGRMCRSEDFLECDARISGVMYFSAADEAEFGQQAEHATVVEVGVYPEAARSEEHTLNSSHRLESRMPSSA